MCGDTGIWKDGRAYWRQERVRLGPPGQSSSPPALPVTSRATAEHGPPSGQYQDAPEPSAQETERERESAQQAQVRELFSLVPGSKCFFGLVLSEWVFVPASD